MYEEEISPELKKRYQDAFGMFDKDKDGTISAKRASQCDGDSDRTKTING